MKEKVTLESIEKQFELNPKVIIQHLEFLKAFTIFTECLNVNESDFETIRASLPNHQFLGYSLNETYMIFIGVKKNQEVTGSNIEYLWIKKTDDPIYYGVAQENIRLLNYIKPPVVNIGETYYSINHPCKSVRRSGGFTHILAEMQSHLVSNFYLYKIVDIRSNIKVIKRKDRLYFDLNPILLLKYDGSKDRSNVLTLIETFGKLASFYKQYNKE